MICCALIAGLLAALLWPLSVRRANPLAWRPDPTSSSGSPGRATGRLQSFAHAFDGLGFAIRNEANMRVHLGMAVFAIAAGSWIGIDGADWRWLVLAIALVLVAESLNTATEQAANAITQSFHPAIKAAKDVAAGAVLLAAAAAAAIGISVFLPHIADQEPQPAHRREMKTPVGGSSGSPLRWPGMCLSLSGLAVQHVAPERVALGKQGVLEVVLPRAVHAELFHHPA